MASAPLEFPASLSELGGMSNAQLVQLVKQEGIDHPQGKSLAYFMSKDNKLDYLANKHYGVAVDIGHVIPAAESKYADFLAKAKAKDAAKKVVSDVGTNCAATAMKDLESAAMSVAADTMPKIEMLQGDMTSFFLDHPNLAAEGVDLVGPMNGYMNGLKALEELTPHEVELQNTLLETLKQAKGALTMLDEGADASGLLQAAAKLDDLVPIYGTSPEGAAMQVLSAQMKSTAETQASNYVTSTKAVTQYVSHAGNFDAVTTADKLDALHDLANVDPKQLTETSAKALDSVVKDLATNLTNEVVPVTNQAVTADILDSTEKIPAKVLGDDAKAAIQDLHEAALTKTQETAWKDYVGDFAPLKNTELKTLAYQELQAAGFQKSLGSFLTKDEKVELLAKLKAEQPVDDLVAKAKEKYLVKEGKAPAQIEQEIADVSVKAPDVQAAEALANPAKPEFDLAKELELSGEEHLAPAEPISIETEPHPAEKVAHVFTPTGKTPGAGSHPMEIFTDENGEKWLFKVQGKWQSEVEDWAAQVGQQLGLNVTELRIEADVQTSLYGVVDGSFQRMLPNVGELGKEGGALGRLSAEQVKDLQRQQVYDWLISNHDSHGQNFLIGGDGGLIPIDKGQAMKFFGTDSLSTTYSPNNSAPAYNKLWESVIRGDITVDLNAIDEMLTRVEQLSDTEYRDMLREHFTEKFATKQSVINAYQSVDTRTLESFIDKALERKQTIRADFEKFYTEVSKRAGIDWTPSWAPDVVKAEKIVEPVTKLAVQGDIATPIDSSFAQSVLDTRAGGQAIHLAGEEINGGQALVWVETDVDGTQILRMEVRLESQADARVTATFQDALGTPLGKVGPGVPVSTDPAFDTIQQAAKTVNHHVTKGDFEPNQQKVDAMVNLNPKLFKAIEDAAAADSKLAAGEIEPEAWALLKAQGEQATHYKQVVNDIQDAIVYQKKVEHVAKFDVDKARAEWMTKQPMVKPKPTLSEPEKLFEKVSQRTEQVDLTKSGDYMERIRIGNVREIDVSASSGPSGEVRMQYGQQLVGNMKVEGADVKTTWTGWNMTSNYPGKGRLTFELKGWDGTEAGVQKMLTALNRLGVDSHLATREEERLTYWKVTTGQMKQSVEYANPQRATGTYKGLRDTIDRIEARITAQALDTRAQIDVYREEMAKQFGQDAVDRAPERIVHIHDLKGREIGYGHFERFDLPADLRPYMEKAGKQWGIARKGRIERETFTGSWGSTGNGEKIRLGMGKAGTSAEADLATGGGTGSFSSMGVTGWQSNGPMIVSNPSSVMRRASSYAADHDNFGRIADRGAENYLNPSEWQRYIGTGVSDNTRELVARDGYSFFDDTELVMARDQGEKDGLIKTFNDLGVTELRGIPIEDRIVVSTNGRMPGVIDRWFRDHSDAYTHSYSSPVDLTPGKAAAKKAVVDAASPGYVPTPSVITGAKGSFEAEKQAYTNALDTWGQSTNSTKAKLQSAANELYKAGVKTSVKGLQDEFAQWWNTTGQYKGISQVKATKSFLLTKVKDAEVKAAVDGLTKPADIVHALKEFQNTKAKQAVIEDVFSKPFTEIVQDWKAEKPGAGGAYGSQFNEWLFDKAVAMSPKEAAVVSTGEGFEFPKIGTMDTKTLEGIIGQPSTVSSVSSKVDQLAKAMGTDFETMQPIISQLSTDWGFNDAAGAITNTLNKILDIAKGTTVEGYKLGDMGVIPKSKIEELLADTKSSASQKIKSIANALGKQDELSDVLQTLLDAKPTLGVSGAADTDTVLKAMLDTLAPAPAPTTGIAGPNIVSNIPVLGDMTQTTATKLQEMLDFAGPQQQPDSLPIYVKDVANVLGFDQATTQAVLDAAAKEYALEGQGWGSVVKEWLHDAEQGGLKIEAKVVEEVAPKVEPVLEAHPGFVAESAPANTGFAYDVVTPLGKMSGDLMNDFTDAAWEIENQTTTIIDALQPIIDKTGQSYGDMLPTLDKYASEKGLGGFPGENPADVLKSFVEDMSKSVSQAIHEAPAQDKPVTWLLDPKNTQKAPVFYNQPIVDTMVGHPVTPPLDSEKVFNYSVNGEKVPVVFAKASGGGTNVIVQEKSTGQWFVLKGTHSGKTTKDEIMALLSKVNHSSIEPF